MAERTQPIRALPGAIAACFVLAVVLGAFAAVVSGADAGRGLGPADWAALRFTVLQAALSAGLSVALAIPVARALSRRRFRGRALLIAFLGAPFLLPVIVAILGMLVVFGRNGWISLVLGQFGLPPIQIYGLHGVVLAHVFFNLPLAVRLILQAWQAIPAERFRLAAQLGCGSREIWFLLEWPALRRAIPGALAVVFAICLTSFAVALTLGGGPKATTLELAIYQAFRFDFDLGRAALLGCIQVGVAGLAGLVAMATLSDVGFGGGLDRAMDRWDGVGGLAKVGDAVAILITAAFLFLPLAAIVVAGLPGLGGLPVTVWKAAGVSLIVAFASTCILLALALPMAATIAGARRGWLETVGLMGLATSPLVIGTGLFLVINPVADPFLLALPVTAVVNAIMALPFALRIFVPAARNVLQVYGRLALSLELTGRTFWRVVLLRRLRPQIGFAAGLTAALSMGDLGVIAMFADPERATLPLQVYRLMGAYRMESAQAAALLLLMLAFGLFWLCDRGGRSGDSV